MKINIGKRNSGKTTKILINASKDTNPIVITPTFARLRVLEHIAKEKDLKHVKVIPFEKFLDIQYQFKGYHLNIYIDDFDEIDNCMMKLLNTGLNFEIKEVTLTEAIK